jgi:16S rRNA processing protein RimM
MEKYIEVGKIINTHGVKGDVKIDSWCDCIEIFCELETVYTKKGGEYQPLEIVKAQPFKEFVLAHIKGVDSFESANLLKNKELYALREDIPLEEGDVFIVDLIGLPVINQHSGKIYAKIKDVIIGVATDIYEIETEHGMAYMPVVPEFVQEVDTEKGVFVTPIEGMFYEI